MHRVRVLTNLPRDARSREPFRWELDPAYVESALEMPDIEGVLDRTSLMRDLEGLLGLPDGRLDSR